MSNVVHAILVGLSVPALVGVTALIVTFVSFILAYLTGYISLLFRDGFEIFYTKRTRVIGCSTYVKVIGDQLQFTEEQTKELNVYLNSQRELMGKVNLETFVFAVSYSIRDLANTYPLAFYKLSVDYYISNVLKYKKELLSLLNTVDLNKKVEILKQQVDESVSHDIIGSEDFKRWVIEGAKKYGCDFGKLEKLNSFYKSQDEVLFSALEKR